MNQFEDKFETDWLAKNSIFSHLPMSLKNHHDHIVSQPLNLVNGHCTFMTPLPIRCINILIELNMKNLCIQVRLIKLCFVSRRHYILYIVFIVAIFIQIFRLLFPYLCRLFVLLIKPFFFLFHRFHRRFLLSFFFFYLYFLFILSLSFASSSSSFFSFYYLKSSFSSFLLVLLSSISSLSSSSSYPPPPSPSSS